MYLLINNKCLWRRQWRWVLTVWSYQMMCLKEQCVDFVDQNETIQFNFNCETFTLFANLRYDSWNWWENERRETKLLIDWNWVWWKIEKSRWEMSKTNGNNMHNTILVSKPRQIKDSNQLMSPNAIGWIVRIDRRLLQLWMCVCMCVWR